MQSFFLTVFFLVTSAHNPSTYPLPQQTGSPLSAFSPAWDNPKYLVCNTAANADYLSAQEKTTIYVLNLARMNPSLFAKTVVSAYPEYSGEAGLITSSYFTSLMEFLQKKKPMPLLYPDTALFESARCHAKTSGEAGYVGHSRRTQACKDLQVYRGECCQYGFQDPLSIVMELLIDEGVPSLGHRTILFKPFTQMGISIQPHKRYRWNAVLDLG